MSGPAIGPRQRLVHGLAAAEPAARGKVRAQCFCGWRTTPQTTESGAREALECEHGYSDPVCAVCGRDRGLGEPASAQWARVRVAHDALGAMFVCSDDASECLAAAARREVERGGLGELVPRPRLRSVGGGLR